ncbi:reverse transcriptase domain-containing protein, partial [Tanacetum coccineum]
MPTWCHMFNSTLTGNARVWFDDLPQDSIDSYDDLKKSFLENYLQQKKCIKDPVEIHNIKQRDGESTEEFVRRGEVAASNHERKKSFPSWKHQEAGQKQKFKKRAFRNQQRPKRKQDIFSLLIKTPKEILALDKGKFKPPPPMTTSVEKRNANKFCEGGKKGGNLRKGKTAGNTDGTTMEDGTEGPMIIKAEMGGHFVHRMVWTEGPLQKSCMNTASTDSAQRSEAKWFPQPRRWSPSPYNGIIWRTGVRRIQAVPSTAYGMLKFPVTSGTVTLQSSGILPLECTMVSRPGVPQPVINQVTEEKIQVAIHPEYLKQTIAIGSTLIEEGRKELCGLLRRNLDVFAWKPADMTGVPRHIAEHRLNICEGCLPVRQKKRGQAPERNKAIYEEVEKLVDVGIMKEVHYHSWLSNPVMVKKHDDSWRMCVDFKDLNKACPKDGYPLPEIDWKVESLCGYPFKCFLDAYKGYHQIQMAKEDEEKTTFITSQGIFCYSKMSFGLKNAGATYQRLVDKAFQKQIGRNLEVYVDDLVIKSRTEQEVIRDIEETFKTLREINMKLNPKKCAFGMREGTFLGYKVNADGLRVCPDKVEAVLNLPSPKCLKDVQKLNGKLASLNRFLSKSAEKSLPFFKTLKKCTKKSDFQWTAEAEMTFKQMKKSIAELPMLTAPKEKEELIMYLAATKEAIRFENQLHSNGKANTCSGSASKRLKRYFSAHTIIVITDQPIKQILSNPEVTGRLLKWSFELEEHDIHYRPRTSVKGQILADFIVERPEDDPQDTLMEDEEALPNPWILFTDGSSCIDGSEVGLIITNPKGVEFTYALRFRFDATNNEVEYEALIAGLQIAEQMGVKNLQANVDSRLVANQVNGIYIAKKPGMIKYLEKVKTLTNTFKEFSIKQVPRGENKKADALSKMASTSFAHLSKQ